jgi:small subunit ribosomal protein S4
VARYTDPVCRICRREGAKLFLKGTRCYSKKCSFERRAAPPGQHGIRRRKVGDYGMQLREKQKIRRIYSVLERQFQGYFEQASSTPGVTGENLLRMLELRLDNVVYRMGFAASRAEARQMVGHAHMTVNGRVVNVASMQVKPGDKIQVRETHKTREPFKEAVDLIKTRQIPEWLTVDASKLAGSVLTAPRRDQMPADLNEQLVVEYYSR